MDINVNMFIQYAVIFAVLLIIALVVIKFHKKDFDIGKTYNDLFFIYIGRIS